MYYVLKKLPWVLLTLSYCGLPTFLPFQKKCTCRFELAPHYRDLYVIVIKVFSINF